MRQPLHPQSFVQPDHFAREQQAIFSRGWQLAGVMDDFHEAGRFRRLSLAGKPWVLRRGSDGLRLFVNVCLHRGSLVCADEEGCGKLRCGYHGWSYDDEGMLAGVPHRRVFPELPPEGARLPSGRVETWGPAIFVNPASNAPALKSALGALHEKLDPWFRAMGPRIAGGALTVRANWKIVVENALEGYHVPLVHPETVDTMDYRERDISFESGSSVCLFDAKIPDRVRNLVEKAFAQRPVRLDGYVHANLFPTSTIASYLGHFYVVTRTEPLDAGTTRLHWWLHRTALPEANSAAANTVGNGLLEGVRDFVARTFEEDVGICEAAHAGVAHATEHGYLGGLESRVEAFERAVAQAMERT